VDVFLSGEPFTRSALSRRRTVELEPGFRTEVVGPEDLFVFMLVAYRPKDRGAIDRLLAVQRDLDWTYVRRWTDRFDALDRFREAGIPEPPA